VLSSLLIRSIRELLFNVVKHSGEKSAAVEVRRHGSEVVIAVKDHGRGCDQRAFREKREKNLSFGLFDIEERVKFIGGCMQVESEADHGFQVTLTVPRDVPNPSNSSSLSSVGIMPPPSIADHSDVAAVTAQTSRAIKILLADDHDLMRDGLAKLLQEQNLFDVVGMAADGRQAVRLAAELEPDVILMDFSMPVMNGIDAAMEISRSLPGISIIGLTMHNDPDIKNAMLKAGACACLSKAVSPEELIESIQTAYSDKAETQGLLISR
jgi:CheY-like chemotaxis protein